MTNQQRTWETYVASWKAETSAEKRALFEKCLEPACQYHDPLVFATGWDELLAYMLDFQRQVPGGHFVTTYFLTHHDKSIARWEMKSADNVVVGEGISYGEYNDSGLLVKMSGFFELPKPGEATQ